MSPATVVPLLLAGEDRLPLSPTGYCVDYLTHSWDLEDLAESWRFVTRQKRSLLNGYRLENASWRVWAKRRHSLPTVRPESLNWLKDNDVTWLYGPLYTHGHDQHSSASTAVTSPTVYAPTSPSGLKPALKRRPFVSGAGRFRTVGGTSPRLGAASYHSLLDLSDVPAYADFLSDSAETLCRSNSGSSLTSEGATPRPRLRFKATVEQCRIRTVGEEDDEDEDAEGDGESEAEPRTEPRVSKSVSPASVVPVTFDPPLPAPPLGAISRHRKRHRTSHRSTIVRLQPTALKAEPEPSPPPSRAWLHYPWATADGASVPHQPPPAARSSRVPRQVVAAPWPSAAQWLGSYMPQIVCDSLWDGSGSFAARLERATSLSPRFESRSDDYGLTEYAEDIIVNLRDIAVWCGAVVTSFSVF
ncbi:protein phosphatase regulator [Tieghemiomyces parasiticus]|uniref:Protein phosphatase regulator n=1 Tax=Tieghemiomyces parasiticus TaxID=78921 RepID=A0A9W8A473_9FUNG|nr:protein phosphatase regulator [Tieghemiomyces parasiticus]